ncbi:MAG: hypothetical protein KAV87_07965 [Desulfobacteraceae bacterium]|nr:hypothetical protein [Desulfobacteraceae bacterium]
MASLSDKELHKKGIKFRKNRILIRLNVSFAAYLYNSERYDKIIEFMDDNKQVEPFIIRGGGRIAVH